MSLTRRSPIPRTSSGVRSLDASSSTRISASSGRARRVDRRADSIVSAAFRAGMRTLRRGTATAFHRAPLNPAVNPPLRAASPATWRRPVPRLRTVEGTPMPRTPERAAPRHAPRIRIGCDVHPISEIAESIELFGERYLARVFTPVERAQTDGPMALERLAGRFAAKEAVLKVLQVPSTTSVPVAVHRGAHRPQRGPVRRAQRRRRGPWPSGRASRGSTSRSATTAASRWRSPPRSRPTPVAGAVDRHAPQLSLTTGGPS